MFRLKESIHIQAPIDRCFLLSTHIDLVRQTIGLKPVAARAFASKTDGLVTCGDRVLWRGWKFGLPASHETLITAYDRPRFFQDSMVHGRFSSFQHDHRFDEVDGHTLLVDIVRFSLPFGPGGRLIGRQIVAPHILGLMQHRFKLLKSLAEGEGWRRYLETQPLAKTAAGAAGILNR